MIDPKTCITFQWVDDETCDIYMDDEYIGELTHETHGWSGIESTVQMLNRMILMKNWDVKVEGDPAV